MAIRVLVNERARTSFGLNHKDVGRPLQDLEVSYRPIELRSLLDQAYAERRVVSVSDIERHPPNGEIQFLDLQIVPLQHNGDAVIGAIISFIDVSQSHRLHEELRRAAQDLETAYEELQSANEELETTNEELQSANEELETMDEELQSSNEELQTVNEELRQRTGEFNRINALLQSVLSIPPSALIVVDRNLNVLLWNQRAEEMWGLRAEEVIRKPLFTLDFGLPIEELRQPINAQLDSHKIETMVILNAINRRGRSIKCEVRISPFAESSTGETGVALMIEDVTDRERLAQTLQQNQMQMRGVVETLPVIILAQDGQDNAIFWSKEAERATGWSPADIVDDPHFLDKLYPDAKYRARLIQEQHQLTGNFRSWQTQVTCKDGGTRTIVWSSRAEQMPIPGWKQWAVGTTVD